MSTVTALLIVSCKGKETEETTVSSVAVSPDRIEITEGESTKLTAKISPAEAADRTVTWSSSDKVVASVDGSGNVQGLKAGSANITATAEGKSGKCTVTVKEKTVSVADVSLDRTELTLTEGYSETLAATVKPDNATNRNVTWKSDKADIASVDGNGKVTALKAGVATVTVTTEDGGKTAACKVNVLKKTVAVSEVTLNKTSLELTEGEDETLKATVKPDNATNKKVTWKADKADIASVDGNGKVTALKAGVATVTVTTEDGGKTAACKVNVLKKTVAVSEVTLNKTSLELTEGEDETLKATVKPDNATNKNVTWKSDKADIASVDGNGKVTALKAGVATVTVTTEDGGKTAACKVNVKSLYVSVAGVEVNPRALTLPVSGTYILSHTIRPTDATNQIVKWESDSPSIATVDHKGFVQGVAAGTTKISVTTEDGGFKSYCTVTVKKPASKFKVGGLWYEYHPGEVQVIPAPDGSKYSGNITIPGQIEYDGITYLVKGIWLRAFYMCADLKTVTLGEGIESIGPYAFCGCSNLERIAFSSTIQSFNTHNPVFQGCPKLEIVTKSKISASQRDYYYTHKGALYSHRYYSASNGTFSKETEVLSWLPEKTTGVFTVKDGVEVIDHYSITRTGIDKIIIPESVKDIGLRLFNESKTPLEIELNWKTKKDIDRISTRDSDDSFLFFLNTDRSAVKVTVPKGTKALYASHWLWSRLGSITERP